MQQVISLSARLISLPQQQCIGLMFVLLLVWGDPSAADELAAFQPEQVSRDFSALGIASKQVTGSTPTSTW